MKNFSTLAKIGIIGAVSLASASSLLAASLSIVSGATGTDIESLRSNLDIFEKKTGNKVSIVTMPSSSTDQFSQYKLWLSAKNKNIDVYRLDVIWAPQIAKHLVDLTADTKDIVKNFFPAIIESQTVNGRLVALPMFADAPALYYRKDLLKKYNAKVPKTWEELTSTVKMILAKENNPKLQGFVFQGSSYEGLTCNALEWIKSYGGGQIVEPDGRISINNKNAIAALNLAKTWAGTISPKGVLAYKEEESRGVWQTGNAIFMRNWPYAYSLGNAKDSAVKGKFAVTTLPSGTTLDASAATLGGWNLGVSKYSQNKKASIELVKFLTSKEVQKRRAIKNNKLPTIISLYNDADIKEKSPMISNWYSVFKNAVPRPSAPVKRSYNEVSKEFYSSVHAILSGNITASAGLEKLERKLKRIKKGEWK